MSELYRAKTYWSSHHFQSTRLFGRDSPDQGHRWKLADFVASYFPSTVLEFGCNSARNLAALKAVSPDASLYGIDINEQSIQLARDVHGPSLTLNIGDETTLAGMSDGEFDVIFTCSVLDHIPTPEWKAVYDQFVRIASKAVVLLEPIIFRDGLDVDADFNTLNISAVPYTYAHNYLTHDPFLRVVRPLPTGGDPWPEFAATYHLLARDKNL